MGSPTKALGFRVGGNLGGVVLRCFEGMGGSRETHESMAGSIGAKVAHAGMLWLARRTTSLSGGRVLLRRVHSEA